MEGRMYSSPLRGVKRSVGALGIIMLSLFITVLFPRPVHAEGFLSQTLRCTLSVLVLKDCRAPQQPPAPVAPSTPVAPSSPSSQPQHTPQAPPSNSPESSQYSPGQDSQPPLRPFVIDPTEVEATPLPVPELPEPAHRQQFTYEPPATYATYRYGMVKGEHIVAQAAVLEPSREGWHILGYAWYWWGLGLALGAAVIIWARRLKNKRTLSIAK